MNILIVQLARLGDILQSLPSIEGLRKKYPDAKITLLVRESFSDAARISSAIDEIIELPTKEVLAPFLMNQSTAGKAESLATLEKWFQNSFQLRKKFDLTINLTFSKASALIMSLLPSKKRLGFFVDRFGNSVIADQWSQYFFAQVLGKNHNIIHLNDLFMRIAGVDSSGWPIKVSQSKMAIPPEIFGHKKLIGLQIGASQAEKTLNLETWASICAKLQNHFKQAAFVFFGSEKEVETIESLRSILEEKSKTFNLAGKFRFHENLSILKLCDALISPDTALVHLASIAEIPIVEIAVGGVRPQETGPYGKGHFVLAPVSSDREALANAVLSCLDERIESKNEAAISKTEFITDSSQNRLSQLTPLNYDPNEATYFFERAYYLLAAFRCEGRQEDIAVPAIGKQPKALDELVQAFDSLCAINRAAEFGQHYCQKILEDVEARETVLKFSEKLSKIEGLLLGFRDKIPLIRPLIDQWTISKDLAALPRENGDLVEITTVTEASYRELNQNADIIKQLLQTAVTAAQKTSAAQAKNKNQKPASRRTNTEKEIS